MICYLRRQTDVSLYFSVQLSLKKSHTKELSQLTKAVLVKPRQLFDAAGFVKTLFRRS